MEKIFLKDYQFTNQIQIVPNVIRTADWGHLHLDNIELDYESILELIEYTKDILNNEEHCSVEKIFLEKRVTCISASIDSSIMLYSILQIYADELFSMNGYPRLSLLQDGGEIIRHSIKSKILDFIKNHANPCPYEVLEERFVNKLGYKESQVYTAVRDNEICKYHAGCVIHLNTLEWNDSKQKELEQVADKFYRNAERGAMLYGKISHLVESDELPTIPDKLYWSKAMVADLLSKGKRFLILGNRQEAYIPINNQYGIHNFETFIGKILEYYWDGAANLFRFEDELIKSGIIQKRITSSMIGHGKIVVIKNGEILLKELLVDA